MKKRTNTS